MGKNGKKWKVLLVFQIILCLLGGCRSSSADTIAYVLYEYDGGYVVVTGLEADGNLTRSGPTFAETADGVSAGYVIYTGPEWLDEIRACVSERAEKVVAAEYRSRYSEDFDPEKLDEAAREEYEWALFEAKGARYAPGFARQTEQMFFDEAFFKENNLLVVDICCYAVWGVEAWPEALRCKADTAVVEVGYGMEPIETEETYGVLLYIPLPKDCTQAVVHFQRDESWSYEQIQWNHFRAE